jgi:hypothetical protein
MRSMMFAAIAALAFTTGPVRAGDASCDTPGVAQMVIPDMFAKNPSAQKLGLELDSVTVLGVDNSGCTVSVKTNHGYSFKYKFQFGPSGVAALDMISIARE